VGQPRDGHPEAAYGLYDEAEKTYRLKRVDYDVATAQKKIIKAGLPSFLAERLSRGI
jgi:diadenosine tetraphosphatase ApaH/serine/threonine PP2A family protein phosphatase